MLVYREDANKHTLYIYDADKKTLYHTITASFSDEPADRSSNPQFDKQSADLIDEFLTSLFKTH